MNWVCVGFFTSLSFSVPLLPTHPKGGGGGVGGKGTERSKSSSQVNVIFQLLNRRAVVVMVEKGVVNFIFQR